MARPSKKTVRTKKKERIQTTIFSYQNNASSGKVVALCSMYSCGGKHSFCQLMTASMPTFIGRNITGIRPTHDCFCANLGHIMTAFMPTLGLTA